MWYQKIHFSPINVSFGHFNNLIIFHGILILINVQKTYLEAKFQYSEGTLFSSILKVEENKVISEI